LVYAPAANISGNNYATIGFKLLDNGGTTNGGVDTSTSAYTLTINVNANIPPTLAGTNTLSYTENDLAKIVNPTITVADSDNPTLASATVSITSGFVASQDTLNFASNATFGNITGSYSATSSAVSGTLVIDGPPPPQSCLGDLNDDHVVSGADLGLLLGNWGGSGVGDLDGNGVVDAADLSTILGAWGECGA
jgi:hypothetical protein